MKKKRLIITLLLMLFLMICLPSIHVFAAEAGPMEEGPGPPTPVLVVIILVASVGSALVGAVWWIVCYSGWLLNDRKPPPGFSFSLDQVDVSMLTVLTYLPRKVTAIDYVQWYSRLGLNLRNNWNRSTRTKIPLVTWRSGLRL